MTVIFPFGANASMEVAKNQCPICFEALGGDSAEEEMQVLMTTCSRNFFLVSFVSRPAHAYYQPPLCFRRTPVSSYLVGPPLTPRLPIRGIVA